MVALLSTNKIDSVGPSRSNAFRVDRFQTDNYSIRASRGFNNAEVKYSITWRCLTQAEANALATMFDNTKGTSLIQWTPPLEGIEQNFTVASYNVALETTVGGTYQYSVSADKRISKRIPVYAGVQYCKGEKSRADGFRLSGRSQGSV